MNIDRFHALGSGLELVLRYDVDSGWSGSAKVLVGDERQSKVGFDPKEEGEPRIIDLDAFVDNLHDRLKRKVEKVRDDAATQDQLEREWRAIEQESAAQQDFQSVRAIHVLKERIKRLEALLLETDE